MLRRIQPLVSDITEVAYVTNLTSLYIFAVFFMSQSAAGSSPFRRSNSPMEVIDLW